jgi:hypothetical protein
MDRSYTVVDPSLFRALSMEGFDAMASGHVMTGLVEVDVTDLRRELRRLRREGRKATFFAAVVHAVAKTLAEFPQFNSMRWGRRIVTFHGVDVNVPVERASGGEAVVDSLVVRGAEALSVDEIAARIEEFKLSAEGGVKGVVKGAPILKLILGLPRFLRLSMMRRLSRSPARVRESFGTTMVTSVPLTGDFAGWVMPPAFGSRAANFALGSIVPKPAACGGEVRLREILHLTIVLNHDLIDGAPAARFASALVRNIGAAWKA